MNLPKIENISQIENKTIIKKKLETIKLTSLLHANNFRKRIGGDYSLHILIYRILVSLFMSKRLKVLWGEDNSIADCLKGAKKDAYYDMLKNPKLNWRALFYGFFMKVAKPLQRLSRLNDQVLIIDDTPNPKTGKKTELISWQYDHVEHRSYKGFTQIYLGWSDGITFLPIDFCIKVGKNIISQWNKNLDKRTSGAKRRSESIEKKTDQAIEMLKRAFQKGISAGYVLYDTWFAKPLFVLSVFNLGYHSVCNIPRGDKIWQVHYNGKNFRLKELYRLLRSRGLFSSMTINGIKQKVASIIVTHKNGLTLKLVFCKVKGQKNWLVFASTDTDQTEYEILKTYAKRWGIECFFKSCKQLLQFGTEQSVDFDVQVAMTTIRLMAYAVSSSIQREQKDDRTLGELFEIIENEFSNLNLDREIIDQIFAAILDTLSVPNDALDEFKRVFCFISKNFTSAGIVIGNCKVA